MRLRASRAVKTSRETPKTTVRGPSRAVENSLSDPTIELKGREKPTVRLGRRDDRGVTDGFLYPVSGCFSAPASHVPSRDAQFTRASPCLRCQPTHARARYRSIRAVVVFRPRLSTRCGSSVELPTRVGDRQIGRQHHPLAARRRGSEEALEDPTHRPGTTSPGAFRPPSRVCEVSFEG